MTREEYVERMNSDAEWAPGWDAVETEFGRLLSGEEPAHYGTEIMRELYLAGIIILTVILSMIQEKVISILSHTG